MGVAGVDHKNLVEKYNNEGRKTNKKTPVSVENIRSQIQQARFVVSQTDGEKSPDC